MAFVYTSRGYSNFVLGNDEDALTDYNTALELDPTVEVALTYRGQLYYFTDQDDLALDDFAAAVGSENGNRVAVANALNYQ